jgi:hypothetical protein
LSRRDRWSESTLCIEVLATVAIIKQQYQVARQWLQQGLEAAASLDFVYAVRTAYFQLGYISVLNNDYSNAAAYWNKAIMLGDQGVGSIVATGFFGKAISGDYQVNLQNQINPDISSS